MSEKRKYLMWSDLYCYSEADAIKGTAETWQGPREMATRWAEWHDINSAEYDIAGKGKTVRVFVKDCATSAVTEWDVTGEAMPTYGARPANVRANRPVEAEGRNGSELSE